MSPEDPATSRDPHATIADLKTWRRFIRSLHPCEHRRGRLPRRRLYPWRESRPAVLDDQSGVLDLSSQIESVACNRRLSSRPWGHRERSLAQPCPARSLRQPVGRGPFHRQIPPAPAAEWPTAGSATGSTEWPSLSRFALRAHGPVGTASPRHLSRRRFRSKLDTVSSLTCSRPLVGSAFVEDVEACSHYVTRTTGLPRDILSPRSLHPYQPPVPPPRSSTGRLDCRTGSRG